MGKPPVKKQLDNMAAMAQAKQHQAILNNAKVASLLDVMIDGKELISIMDKFVEGNLNSDISRALSELETVRGRPCIVYCGNVIKGTQESSIDPSDDLIFYENIKTIPSHIREVDVFLTTAGGSGDQVSKFVNYLRSRFDVVDFLIPDSCMSAGTLFALSGDNIYMTPNACLGPIDPQFPTQNGYFPAQGLMMLVKKIQQEFSDAQANNKPLPYTSLRIIDGIDKMQYARALNASEWSVKLVAEYLEKYKFSTWTTRESTQQPVTQPYKAQRAKEISEALGNHELWLTHAAAISREQLWEQLKLKIEHPNPELLRVMTRLWALFAYIFSRTNTQKVIVSDNAFYFRNSNQIQ